jgi:hypothetical protein
MAVPSWSWLSGDLRTGQIWGTLPAADGSWSQVMDDAGQFSVTLNLGDPPTAAINPRLRVQPCRSFICLAYNAADGAEYLIDGGPVWTHSYDAGSRQLQVGAAGIWSYWDHRFILPVLAAGVSPSTQVVQYGGVELGTVAQQLIILAGTHTGGNIPVVFPPALTGLSSRTYPGFNMTTVGSALRDLTAVDGGPEIQFAPRRRADDPRFLQWVMRVGTAAAPLLTQAGDDHVFDFGAVRGSVGGLTVDVDGQAMTERAWVQGAGTDTATLFGRADNPTLLTAGFPLLESLDSEHSGENGASVPATLAGYARVDVAGGAVPQETWNATVQRDSIPRVHEWGIGDWAAFMLPSDDPYVQDPSVRGRVVSRSGNMTGDITVQLQPELI